MTGLIYKTIIYIVCIAYNCRFTWGKLFLCCWRCKKGRNSWHVIDPYFTWKYHNDQWVVAIDLYSWYFNWPTRLCRQLIYFPFEERWPIYPIPYAVQGRRPTIIQYAVQGRRPTIIYNTPFRGGGPQSYTIRRSGAAAHNLIQYAVQGRRTLMWEGRVDVINVLLCYHKVLNATVVVK